jgi:hypothetical protein
MKFDNLKVLKWVMWSTAVSALFSTAIYAQSAPHPAAPTTATQPATAQQPSVEQQVISYLFNQRDQYEIAVVNLQDQIKTLQTELAKKDATPKPQAEAVPNLAVEQQLTALRQQLENTQVTVGQLNRALMDPHPTGAAAPHTPVLGTSAPPPVRGQLPPPPVPHKP